MSNLKDKNPEPSTSSETYGTNHINKQQYRYHKKSSLTNINHNVNVNMNHNKNETSRKRRYTVGSDAYKSLQRKRRKNDFNPPTVFLLGGNIHDPLNLGGINSNTQQTPETSPFPTESNKEKVEVFIPPNLNDPLNLSCPHGLTESDLISPSSFQRNKRRRTSSESEVNAQKSDLKCSNDKSRDDSFISRRNMQIRFNREVNKNDQIVSPVVPQKLQRIPRNKHNSNRNQNDVKSNSNKTTNDSLSKTNKNQSNPFQYGNYNRYYGYRNVQECDPRIELLPKDFFEGKCVLDIGCNIGHITLTIARDYHPKQIVGIDIDPSLIKIATKNIRHYVTEKVMKMESFPMSMPILYGPITNIKPNPLESNDIFPNNILFYTTNYVPENDECLSQQKPQYDCILCLSLTKWIHLNWGDDGLKRMFRRIFLHLHPGGRLILEPQPWSTYQKKSKMTPQIFENYKSIRFKPEHFNEYLLRDVGFKSCEFLGTPEHKSKGFQRPIYMYQKSM